MATETHPPFTPHLAAEHRRWHDEDAAGGGTSATCWKCAAHIRALIELVQDAADQRAEHSDWDERD